MEPGAQAAVEPPAVPARTAKCESGPKLAVPVLVQGREQVQAMACSAHLCDRRVQAPHFSRAFSSSEAC